MIAVIAGTRLFERPILNRGNSRAGVVCVLAIDALRKRVERVEEKSLRESLLELHRAGVECRVAEIGPQQDIAAFAGYGRIVLRRGEYLGLEGRVSCAEVDRERVGLPPSRSVRRRRTLIADIDHVILRELVLDAGVPIHDVRIAQSRIPP